MWSQRGSRLIGQESLEVFPEDERGLGRAGAIEKVCPPRLSGCWCQIRLRGDADQNNHRRPLHGTELLLSMVTGSKSTGTETERIKRDREMERERETER